MVRPVSHDKTSRLSRARPLHHSYEAAAVAPHPYTLLDYSSLMFSTSVSPSASQSRIPKTPMRRFMCKLELFRPHLTLGKRSRQLDYVSTVADNTPQHGQAPISMAMSSSDGPLDDEKLDHSDRASEGDILLPGRFGSFQVERNLERARLAIQLHDRPLDAVVVTTLPRFPFCCHEDLITMSRQQLVDVAVLFNAQLPRSIQIDHSEGASAAHIRHCIESLVGLIPNVPGAPKAAKSRQLERIDSVADLFSEDSNPDIVPSPPTSPLAMHYTRRHGIPHVSSSSGLLESLEEEEENPLVKKRAFKKRKIFDTMDVPTQYYDTQDDLMDITPIRPLRLSANAYMSSSPDICTPDHGAGLLSPLRARLQKRSNRALHDSKNKLSSQTRLRAGGRAAMNSYGKGTRKQQVNHAIGMYGMENSLHGLENDNDMRMDVS